MDLAWLRARKAAPNGCHAIIFSSPFLPISRLFQQTRWMGDVFQEVRIDKRFIKMNERIRAREVRVIGADGEQLGIMTPQDATRKAREQSLDLVEISATAQPPVCRIMH